MPDGTRLSARLWLPILPKDERSPAILEYIPYRKRDMVRARDERNHSVFARAGYACVRVDMRGSGDSEGQMMDMYDTKELDDAVEVINWIATQPWCTGSVGMMGTSWGGTSALQTAARRPEALKAIVAVCATNNRYEDDIHHMGGCLLTDTVEWGATLPAILASPPDPETVGPGWRALWKKRLEGLSFPLENWIRHETKNEYWRWGSVSEYPEAITCPVLMIGGWSDRYSNTVMSFLEQGHDRCWGIVGPWGHHYPDQGSPGPAIAFQQEAIRWWDHWLKGVDKEIENHPRLLVWLQEYQPPQNKISIRKGRWIDEQVWPSNNVSEERLWLSTEGLVWEEDNRSTVMGVPDTHIVGAAAGDTGYFGREGGLSLDQEADDQYSLVFESLPLEHPIEILGRIELSVSFTSDQPLATLIARLNDVPTTGSVSRVAYGVRNLALTDDLQTPMPFETGQTNSCRLLFHNTAYRFEKGHRIRLALSSTYWPMIWPSPVCAHIALYLSDMCLKLPVRSATADESSIMFPAAEKSQSLESHVFVTDPSLRRESEIENSTGRRLIGWHQPRKGVKFPKINLTMETETKARHEITETPPYNPSTEYEHELRYFREDWDIRIISKARLTSTDKTYQLNGAIKVTENDRLVFERDWSQVLNRAIA